MLCTLGWTGLSAQLLSPDAVAIANIQAEYAQLGLTKTDVAELRISDDYESRGVRHIYVQQYYQGVPVYNAIAGMHFKDGELAYRTSNLSTGFEEQLPIATPSITHYDAVVNAARPLDITKYDTPALVEQKEGVYTYSWGEISEEPITARLVFANLDGTLKLAWQIYISQINTSDMWVIDIDAASGQPLRRGNYTLYCSFNGSDSEKHKNSHMHVHKHTKACIDGAAHAAKTTNTTTETTIIDGSAYNVFPLGIEAPLFGGREIVQEPADLIASPFGWHDTNGQAGAEFTTNPW